MLANCIETGFFFKKQSLCEEIKKILQWVLILRGPVSSIVCFGGREPVITSVAGTMVGVQI